ncbi:MAG: hypothetical protein IKC18_02105, partial [Bacteroidaceae bacterium]|nr:hypothetical protein [Bacteroidaceae bacterium]
MINVERLTRNRLEDGNRQPPPLVPVFADGIILSLSFPRVQEPAAIRPSGFPSSRRFSAING